MQKPPVLPRQDQTHESGRHGPAHHRGQFVGDAERSGMQAPSPSTPCRGQRHLPRTKLIQERDSPSPPPLPSPFAARPPLTTAVRSCTLLGSVSAMVAPVAAPLPGRAPPLPPLASASGPRHCGKCSPYLIPR